MQVNVFNGQEIRAGQVWRYYDDNGELDFTIISVGLNLAAQNRDGYVYDSLSWEDALDGMYLLGNGSVVTVLEEVERERARQDAKWGQQNHGFADWMLILTEEVGEVAKEACDYRFTQTSGDKVHINDHTKRAIHAANYRMELVQVAAVAVAMIESFDRNEGKK